MMKEQCVSITDLRTKTKAILDKLGASPKFVFVNNRPVAVLMDVEDYERAFARPDLLELAHEEVGADMKAAALRARESKNHELVNI